MPTRSRALPATSPDHASDKAAILERGRLNKMAPFVILHQGRQKAVKCGNNGVSILQAIPVCLFSVQGEGEYVEGQLNAKINIQKQ